MNVLVLGDSHVSVFESRSFRLCAKLVLPDVSFTTCCVRGATISGIENPNSKTNARKVFQEFLKKHNSIELCLICMGEVDTGFVLWYKMEKAGISITSLLNKTVEKYSDFLQYLKDDNRKVVVLSTPLPTIGDDETFGEVANLRKEIKATQVERTSLTIDFNRKMQDYCNMNGIYNINIDKQSIGRRGVVKRILRNLRKTDHHYNNFVYSLFIVVNFRRLYGKLK